MEEDPMTEVRAAARRRLTEEQSGSKPPNGGESERARRQDDLLDEALKETFPASDPVSVVHLD